MLDQIVEFIQPVIAYLVANIQNLTLAGLLGFIFTLGIAKFLPNKWALALGRSVGRWSSKKGRKLLGKEVWEKSEDKLLAGTLVAFADGVVQGANEDDSN